MSKTWALSKRKNLTVLNKHAEKSPSIFWRYFMDNNPQNELKDIQEAIMRFLAANGNDVIFIADFLAYDRKTGKIKDNILGLYGDKTILVETLNDLRNIIEDAKDKDNFINI